jgi:hypothetical protein
LGASLDCTDHCLVSFASVTFFLAGLAGGLSRQVFVARRGSAFLLAVVAAAGLAAGFVVPGGGATVKGSDAASLSRMTRVPVTAMDSKFPLSKGSAPVGAVIFTVTNTGTKPHDFKIAGKKTPLLAPRHSARLPVTFSRQGRYAHLSTISGQAGAGLKGVFLVVATVHANPYNDATVRLADRAGRHGQHNRHRSARST